MKPNHSNSDNLKERIAAVFEEYYEMGAGDLEAYGMDELIDMLEAATKDYAMGCVEDNRITTLTGDPAFKFDGSPETFKRLWNAHIDNMITKIKEGKS